MGAGVGGTGGGGGLGGGRGVNSVLRRGYGGLRCYVSFLSSFFFFFVHTYFFAPSSWTIVDGHRGSITSELPVACRVRFYFDLIFMTHGFVHYSTVAR